MPVTYTFSDDCNITSDAFGLSGSGTFCTYVQVTEPTPTSIDFSVDSLDTEQIALYFGGMLFLWGIGLGIGLMIQTLRRFKL